MRNWVRHPTVLRGENLDLLPLEPEHFPQLQKLASDKRIWEFYPYDASNPARFASIYNIALKEREKGTQYPFVIFHKAENRIIGSTRFLDIQPLHRKLEIGATWLQKEFWASAVNPECKLLLLTHCFEVINASRVQLKTDENNWRSRKAIGKIGGKFEGILRNESIRDNGTKRHSAFYSIIEEEWPETKEKLRALLEGRKAV